jgi:hypothetical protein
MAEPNDKEESQCVRALEGEIEIEGEEISARQSAALSKWQSVTQDKISK